MPLDAKCPGCGQLLRVDDEQAGKRAACPSCRTVYVVPPGPAPIAPTAAAADFVFEAAEPGPGQHPLAAAADDGGAWFMKTPEGHVYGPVSTRELDRWTVEGRVSYDCELRLGQNGLWAPADERYPVLMPVPFGSPRKTTDAAPHQAAPAAPAHLYTGPSPPPEGAYWVAHRGVLVLLNGILGWVLVCPVFGLVAWIIGTSDLREMREGRMNPAGIRLTKVGRILGIFSTLVWIAILMISAVLLVIGAIVRAW